MVWDPDMWKPEKEKKGKKKSDIEIAYQNAYDAVQGAKKIHKGIKTVYGFFKRLPQEQKMAKLQDEIATLKKNKELMDLQSELEARKAALTGTPVLSNDQRITKLQQEIKELEKNEVIKKLEAQKEALKKKLNTSQANAEQVALANGESQ